MKQCKHEATETNYSLNKTYTKCLLCDWKADGGSSPYTSRKFERIILLTDEILEVFYNESTMFGELIKKDGN